MTHSRGCSAAADHGCTLVHCDAEACACQLARASRTHDTGADNQYIGGERGHSLRITMLHSLPNASLSLHPLPANNTNSKRDILSRNRGHF